MSRLVLLFLVSFVVYISDSYKITNLTDARVENVDLRRDNYTHYAEGLGWFRFHFMPETWQQASLRCQNEGSVLVSPLDNKLLESMTAIMAQHHVSRIFTGISAVNSSGEFKSVEGVTLEQIPSTWVPGEPDNLRNQEKCIAVYSYGSLADVDCAQPLPYLCYKKTIPDISNISDITDNNKCGTSDTEYKFDERTGKCYKLHRFGKNWSEANSTCVAEDGHLAIINSETEAQVLKEIIEKNPVETLHAQQKDIIAVGFSWSERANNWMTIHGQTLEEAGYNHWAQGEPNNIFYYGEGEYCGSIHTNGKLNDNACTKVTPFICEKHSMKTLLPRYIPMAN